VPVELDGAFLGAVDRVDEVLGVAGPAAAGLVRPVAERARRRVVPLARVEVGADAQRDVAGAALAVVDDVRRAVKPEATAETSGGGTIRPPVPA